MRTSAICFGVLIVLGGSAPRTTGAQTVTVTVDKDVHTAGETFDVTIFKTDVAGMTATGPVTIELVDQVFTGVWTNVELDTEVYFDPKPFEGYKVVRRKIRTNPRASLVDRWSRLFDTP